MNIMAIFWQHHYGTKCPNCIKNSHPPFLLIFYTALDWHGICYSKRHATRGALDARTRAQLQG